MVNDLHLNLELMKDATYIFNLRICSARVLFVAMFLLLVGIEVYSQTTLVLTTDKPFYQKGDTILLKMQVPEWENTLKLGTVNIVIEEMQHKQSWKLRYPVVDGSFETELVIPYSFQDGSYIVTAALQPVFFQLAGKVLNYNKEDSIRYTLQLEDNTIIAGTLSLNKEGAFRMPRHLFSGSGKLFFTPYKVSKKKNTLNIAINTPLDSAYNAIASAWHPLSIGVTLHDDTAQLFSADSNLLRNLSTGTLHTVVVTAKAKTKAEKLDDSYTSGFFKDDRAKIFSGLDGEFSGFMTILDYLHGRVPGLTILKDTEEFGLYDVSWRNQPSAFFIDEIPVDVQAIYNFPPSDIAYLKVIPPPFQGMILGGGGGAIAIYSRRATLGLEPRFRNTFLIQGFSREVFVLQPVVAE
jgi:hypothetical protein